ncbi:ABC transporter permease subunit [Bacillus suaedaesalsae]|uniref:ABC transporter permease subunit n=1 Tax=Bacillus suaedaesalsae TaxID=2810349 RepID=A0ABS2DK35_9BACI|nr:ABC transporter permease subunit [Bacillus suaedaesalsae]MBM6618777.1 ABC transporter permease subunit [Bacillus suaedaesalsae]
MKKLRETLLKFSLSFVGIIVVGGIPSLFKVSDGQYINLNGFLDAIKVILNSFLHLEDLTYIPTPNVEYPLFPHIFHPIAYSLILLFSSLAIAYAVSILLTIGTLLLPSKLVRRTKVSLSMLDSIPDLLLIYSFQLFIIFLYKKTGMIFFNFAALPGEKIYFLPIVCLSIYPAVFLFRLTITLFEEEFTRNYITLAKGKGIGMMTIMYKHILPNITVSLVNNSKNVMWFMLTNLLILERMFNIPGITTFIFQYISPEVFVIGLLLLFIPTFILNTACELAVEKNKKVM